MFIGICRILAIDIDFSKKEQYWRIHNFETNKLHSIFFFFLNEQKGFQIFNSIQFKYVIE